MTDEGIDVMTCILRARKKWLATPSRGGAVYTGESALQHTCGADTCEFIQEQCVFICKATGNAHICTVELCNNKCDMREYRACSISRKEYPLQLIGQTESDNVDYSSSMMALSGMQETKHADFMSTGGKGTGVKTADQARKKRSSMFHKMAVDKDMNQMRATVRKVLTGLLAAPEEAKNTSPTTTMAPVELTAVLQPFARSHRYRRGAPVLSPTAVTGPIRHIPQSVSTRRFRERVPERIGLSEVPDSVFEELQTRCVDLWMRIRGTDCYLAKQHAYDFKVGPR